MTGAADLGEREAELVRRFGARIKAVRSDIADRNQSISGLYQEAKTEGLRPGLLRLALADRRRDRPTGAGKGCQFIGGEPTGGDACKCGQPIRAGSAYCVDHHDACHRLRGSAA